MNFSFSFYHKMKSDLSEPAYEKAFEIARQLEWSTRDEWKDIIHTACNNTDYIGCHGVTVEHWFNCNLLWV